VPVVFAFDFKKALAGVVYLASSPVVTALDRYKLGKLIFLADKYHLVRHGRPIFGDYYWAFEYGPGPQHILNMLREVIVAVDRVPHGEWAQRLAEVIELDRRWENPRIKPRVRIEDLQDSLSVSDRRALDYVIERHGKKDFDELKAMTHEMVAYRRAWGARGRKRRAPMKYEDFFDEDPEAIAGTKAEMLENYALRRAFPEPRGL